MSNNQTSRGSNITGDIPSTVRAHSCPSILLALDCATYNSVPISLSSSVSLLPAPPHRFRSHSWSITRSRTRSPSRDHKNESPTTLRSEMATEGRYFDLALSPLSKGKKGETDEESRAWEFTKARIEKAASSVLDVSSDIMHETLKMGVEVLPFVPVVGLQEVARTLLDIWDSLQLVERNRMACLRLTQRCADILLSVKDEIDSAGAAVACELGEPMAKLCEAFRLVQDMLQRQSRRSAFTRYLKREDIVREITDCDAGLGDALEMFGLSVQIKILKQMQVNEMRRREDVETLCESLRSAYHLPLPVQQEHAPLGLMLSGVQARPQAKILYAPPSPSLSLTPTPTPLPTPGPCTPASPPLWLFDFHDSDMGKRSVKEVLQGPGGIYGR